MDGSVHGSPPVGHIEARIAALVRQLSDALLASHSLIAESLGLSFSEYKCLHLIERAGRSLTAGQVAVLSGLSTGAITGVIDRLERANYVRRVPHPHDRRKVLVELSEVTVAGVRYAASAVMPVPHPALEDYSAVELAAIERYFDDWVRVISSKGGEPTREATGPQ